MEKRSLSEGFNSSSNEVSFLAYNGFQYAKNTFPKRYKKDGIFFINIEIFCPNSGALFLPKLNLVNIGIIYYPEIPQISSY